MSVQETSEMIKVIIQLGAKGKLSAQFVSGGDPEIKPDMIVDKETEQTILHLACQNNVAAVVEEALEIFYRFYNDICDKTEYYKKLGEWVNCVDSNGKTALK